MPEPFGQLRASDRFIVANPEKKIKKTFGYINGRVFSPRQVLLIWLLESRSIAMRHQKLFYLTKSITRRAVQSCAFQVYAHQFKDDLYIGYSNDVVTRWASHLEASRNDFNANHLTRFSQFLRRYRGSSSHFIVANAKTEQLAREKEAAAIAFYRPSLNIGATLRRTKRAIRFDTLDPSECQPILLQSCRATMNNPTRDEWDRFEIKAQIIWDRNKKRLISLENPYFDSGLFVECSRKERDRFEVGDIVYVEVAESFRSSGANYLVAPKQLEFILAT